MKIIKKLRVFCAFICSACAVSAADKALLNALVSKGIITNSEAEHIAKENVEISFLRPTTKSLTIQNRMQFQYETLEARTISGPGLNGWQPHSNFLLRRCFIWTDASLGGGWDVRVSLDLARQESNGLFTDTYISKKFDSEYVPGTLYLGYMKPGFCHEDVVSSMELDCIERSVASMYWTGAENGRRMGIGNRYVGVRWNGNVPQVEGLSYILAITNSFQLGPIVIDENLPKYEHNDLSYWASVKYNIKYDKLNVNFGVYTQFSPTANVYDDYSKYSAIASINPYIAGNYGNLYFWTEYLASAVTDGKENSYGNREMASPYGVNFSVEYRFDVDGWGQVAPVFRYSWLDTDGRGLTVGDAERHAPNLGTLYNRAQAFYFGVNWYINGQNLKVQLGYEYTQLSGSVSNAPDVSQCAECNALRLQIQVRL